MSNYYTAYDYEHATEVPCPRCEAKVGQGCTTLTGRPATWPHTARWRPLADAYTAGYTEGRAQ